MFNVQCIVEVVTAMMPLSYSLSSLCFFIIQTSAKEMFNVNQVLGHLVDVSNYDVKIMSENLKQSDMR